MTTGHSTSRLHDALVPARAGRRRSAVAEADIRRQVLAGTGTTTRPPVAPPPVAGRDLPQAEVRTPEVAVEATTVQGARLRLG